MAKIPKGLSDKDMLQGYVEELTMEARFLAAEEAEDKRRRARALGQEKSKKLSGLDDELADRLGRLLLELKVDLMREGIRNYTMKIKRDGKSLIITPVEKKG